MSCYRPLKAFRTSTGVSFSELRRDDHIGSIEIPCGQCIGCRMRRASDWELRVMHEASLWPDSCFVTLTYGRDQCPAFGSLDHRDFQLFMKRVRKRFGVNVRFYMCGEYGPKHMRPHFHACLFNVGFRDDRILAGTSGSGSDFYESEILSKLWGLGRASVQDLTRETAGYCARYIMKKALGKDAETIYSFTDIESGEIMQLKAEYSAMSLRPGIGAGWFARFASDVFPRDYVVADGVKRRPPRYYDKLFKRSGDVRMDSVEFAREERAVLSVADNSDERRKVREVVHTARMRNHLRSVE